MMTTFGNENAPTDRANDLSGLAETASEELNDVCATLSPAPSRGC